MCKKLIWLEDHPELNRGAQNILAASDFELIICVNVEAFGEVVKTHKDKADQIAGFILDVVIPTESLDALDIPQVMTQRGAETGYVILRQYIRNIRSRSPMGDAFREHPVLILSAMSEASMNSSFITSSDKSTTWLSKADNKGRTDATLKSIQQWLQKLKGSL